MKKIFITGGAGYIGSVFVPELLRHGYVVTVLDNFMYGQHSLLDVMHEKNFKLLRGDARDETMIQQGMEGAEFIIPLACIVGAPACDRDPIAARTTNIDAIELIVRLRKPEQKIIFPTTNSGYGIGQKGKFCDETTPLTPVSFYGRTKVEAEQKILASGESITLRLATVFGASPRMRTDLLVNDFVRRALEDRFVVLFEADFARNYIHIRDVARAFLHCMEHFDTMKGHAYNVGLSNANLTKRELCAVIQKHIPDFVFIESAVGQDPDKRDYLVSNAKIEATGFMPQYALSDGIAELKKTFQVVKGGRMGNA